MAAPLQRILDWVRGRPATPTDPVAAREPRVRRILLTGAAGGVAGLIRPALAERYEAVRLTDRVPVANLAENEEFVQAALEDSEDVDAAVSGMDGIVHLGGASKEQPLEALIPANIVGMHHMLEAARRHGVPRFVFASTMHLMGFYERTDALSDNSPIRPDSRYAATKAFGEALAQVYARKHGIAVTCIRIGHATADEDSAEPGNWIGPDDLAALVEIGLEHPAIAFEILPAIAPCRGDAVDRGCSKRLGHRYRHHGQALAPAQLASWFGHHAIALKYRGGHFAAAEFGDRSSAIHRS